METEDKAYEYGLVNDIGNGKYAPDILTREKINLLCRLFAAETFGEPRKEPDPVEVPGGDCDMPDDDGGADGMMNSYGQPSPQEAIATLNSLLNLCSTARGM